jgi:pimeloyl-ACP methyl ester carboxylesterase
MRRPVAGAYVAGMSTSTTRVSALRKQVHANGTDIHYVDVGEGKPLLLLHGGFVSNDPLWEGHPAAYYSHHGAFATRFRVIAPDARGQGRTLNPGGGSISYTRLADDVLALSAVLALEKPLICGFSEGGAVAMLAAIRSPNAFGAVINHGGFDLLDPRSPTFALSRQVFGGSPDATRPKPESFEAFCAAQGGGLADLMRRMQLDHRDQGAGGWKDVLAMAFQRMTAPSDVTLEDLRQIGAPALILAGDRDMFCSAEEAVAAYRMLQRGELGIVPGAGHELSEPSIRLAIEFLSRHAR